MTLQFKTWSASFVARARRRRRALAIIRRSCGKTQAGSQDLAKKPCRPTLAGTGGMSTTERRSR
eukprot:7407621-Karenia_brevis.AAC.1